MKNFKFYPATIILTILAGFSSCEDVNEEKAVELEVSPVELSVGNAAGTYELQITANGEWEALTYNSWCTVSPESGVGNATLTVSLNENADGENRSSTIEVNTKNAGGKSISKKVVVTQLAYIPFISVNQTEMNVSHEATIIEVVVKTNLPKWYVITFPSVIGWKALGKDNYTKPDGAGSEWETNLRFELAENTRSVILQGSILFGNSISTIKTSVAITQAATEYAFFAADGGQEQKEVIGSWTASSNADWCTVPASGSGNISIAADANTNVLPRKAVITLTSGDKTRKINVAQEPKRIVNTSQIWTEVNGTRHTSIPAGKKFWETGEVLEYRRATKGDGIKIVLFNDAFNSMEMAVGGIYETTSKELAELFLSMPVLRDYKEYFDVFILMRQWEKSGIYNQYNFKYKAPHDGRQDDFLPHIKAMPQLQGVPNNKITGIYYANGFAGGYMSSFSGLCWASYGYNNEPNPAPHVIHEVMGHAFTLLGDMYNLPTDFTKANGSFKWNFLLKEGHVPVYPVMNDPIGDMWEPNDYIVEWNQEAWDAFISTPGFDGYDANIDIYRMPLPTGYRQAYPGYTGGDYVWRIDREGERVDCMVNHMTLHTTGWDRYLIYRRIMRLAGQPYSVVDFFKQDLPYAPITVWDTFLGVRDWRHSVKYDPEKSPFMPWDVNNN
jgi:hypothetical protein